jgi:hypothetical protein
MKQNRTNRYKNGLGKMVTKISMIAVILGFSLGINTIDAQAQKPRVVVEPDNFPLEVGVLNRAIEQNGADVVYVLRNGKTYFLEAILNYTHDLHIEAETWPSNNPPIIRVATNLLGQGRQLSNYRGNVIARGIFFFGIDDMGGKQFNQRSGFQNIHMHYQYCYFAGSTNYIWWIGAAGNTLRLEDSQIANIGRHTSIPNQRVIDARGNDVDSIIVVNTSMYNLNFRPVQTSAGLTKYLYWNHNTVVNHSQSGFDLYLAREATIKNSLFYRTSLEGQWEAASVVGSAGPGFEGQRYFSTGGMITVRSYDIHFAADPEGPRDRDRKIVISNNNFGGLPPQQYLDLWNDMTAATRESNPTLGRSGSYSWGTDPQWRWDNPTVTPDSPIWALRDTIPLVRIWTSPMDSTILSWGAEDKPWGTIQNNIRENVTIVDMPDDMVGTVRQDHFGGAAVPHYDRWAALQADPNTRFFHPGPGTPTNTTGTTAAWFRNLAYNTDAQSYQHAENGYPVGNLNFFPELREKWGRGEVLVSVDKPDEMPGNYRLVGNYPNPFNPTTNIVFELASATEVNIDIFNILGQRVASLPLGLRSVGQHEVSFDASNLSSGTYFVRMQVGNGVQSRTHTMTLLK